MRYYALDKNHCTFATEIDRIMKKWLLVAVVMMMTLTVGANDGVYGHCADEGGTDHQSL